MTFFSIIQQLIHHGFKFPRLHPDMEVEELSPSFEHPNEFITAEELAAAKIHAIEEQEKWEQSVREGIQGQRSSDSQTSDEEKETRGP